ncbi:MAG: 50S ribosomal protein L31e [Candidatus ainarchaeum sp.]|nr:50S ribosomal protein L31e [Candidatus ainarchaeum sp.]
MPAESYIIPLRKAYDKPRTKRANVAVGLVYDFLRKHTRKEKENVFLSKEVNEFLWKNSIRYPPRKIEVSLKNDKENIYVFLKDSDAFKNYDLNKAKEVKKKQSVKDKLEEVRDSMVESKSSKNKSKETSKVENKKENKIQNKKENKIEKKVDVNKDLKDEIDQTEVLEQNLDKSSKNSLNEIESSK